MKPFAFTHLLSRPRMLLAGSLLSTATLSVVAVEAPAMPAKPQVASAGGTGQAATPQQATAARQAAAKAIDAAVAVLLKEYQAFAKDGKGTLREKPDYFITNKSADINDEALITALNRSLSSDGPADSYIKWQLMSGFSPKIDDKLALKLITAYRSAASPWVRPGLRNADKRELDMAVRSAGQNDVAGINSKLAAAVADIERRNVAILEYRDVLFERLPQNFDAVTLGLEDAYMRAEAGISSKFGVLVLGHIRNWAVTGTPPPEQLRSLGTSLRKMVVEMGGVASGWSPSDLRDAAALADAWAPLPGDAEAVVGDAAGAPVIFAAAAAGAKPVPSFPPQYYVSADFDPKLKRVVWKSEAAKFVDKKRLADDSQYLLGLASNPGGGIKFKDK